MHEPDPDAASVPGAAKRNLVGLRTAEMRSEKGLTVAMEKFGLPTVSLGAEP